jgi:hypothetical protein
VSWREQLEHAIAIAHLRTPDPLRCPECGCSIVTVEHRAALGWIPVSLHFAEFPDACPVLHGGLAAQRCYLDLLDALAPYLPLAHYGEAADTGLADAELAAL